MDSDFFMTNFRDATEEADREQTQRIDKICSMITCQPFDKDHFEMLARSLQKWVEEAASWGEIKGETSTVVSLQDAVGGLEEIRVVDGKRDGFAEDEAVDSCITQRKEDRHA